MAELALQTKDFSGKLLPARSAAQLLQCAPDYIGKLCREGRLRGRRVNQAWFVEEGSVQEFQSSRATARAARSQELSVARKQELLKVAPKKVRSKKMYILVPLLALLVGGAVSSAPFLATVGSASLAAAAHLDSPFFGSGEVALQVPQLFDTHIALDGLGDILSSNIHVQFQVAQGEPGTPGVTVSNGITATTLNKILSSFGPLSGKVKINSNQATGAQLCLDDVCMTKEQLKALIDKPK